MTIILIVILCTCVPILMMYVWKRTHPYLLFYHVDGTITNEVDYDKPLHRLDGPALIIGKYRKEYWVYGKQHNLNGPAVVDESVGGDKQYYISGIEVKEKTFLRIRYCSKQDLAIYLVSPRQEIRELAEHRLKELLLKL